MTRHGYCPCIRQCRLRRWRWCGPGCAFVAVADATQLTSAEQAGSPAGTAWSGRTRSRWRRGPRCSGAFTAGQEVPATVDHSRGAWLMHQTGITLGRAVSHTAWMKWARAHPAVYAAMSAERISESYAGDPARGPTSCRRTRGRRRMRSCPARRRRDWTCRTWPRWRRRSWPGAGRTSRTRTRARRRGPAWSGRMMFEGAGIIYGDGDPAVAGGGGAVGAGRAGRPGRERG